jgi:ABC-type transport system substrate-binding protein
MTRTLVGMILVALVAAACARGNESAETTTSTLETTSTSTSVAPETMTTTEARTGKTSGGSAVVGLDFEPLTLNPYAEGGDAAVVALIGQAWLTGVWEIDGYTLGLIPEVVTELPTVGNGGVTVNDDGTMTVRYSISDEAMWSDGVPISGHDFAFTHKILLDLDSTFHDTDSYRDIVSLEAGAKTFTYTMAAPTIAHEQMFRYLIPAHAVADSDFLTDWNDSPWPSAGPFVIAEWEPGAITLERNDYYWKTDAETGQHLPHLDSLVFTFIPEADQLVTAFRSREVHVIGPPPDPVLVASLREVAKEGAVVEILPGPIVEHVNFQFGPGRLARNPASVNHNLDYRRAVAQLIDRVSLEEAAYGMWEPLTSWFAHFGPALDGGAWDRYPYDVDAATALLDQARAEDDRQRRHPGQDRRGLRTDVRGGRHHLLEPARGLSALLR